MSDAQARGWGDPDQSGYRQKNITQITLNCGVKLWVHKSVARLFKGFFDELEAETGYSLADQGQPDDWGYNNRDIRGRPGVKSNHSWGLAVDANAEENPMQSSLKTNMPPQTAALAAKWGLRWGASYTGRKDAMHFEFEGRPVDVQKYPSLTATPKPPPAPTQHHQEDDDMIRIYDLKFDDDPTQYVRIGNELRPISAIEKAELLQMKPADVLEVTVYGPNAWQVITDLCKPDLRR